MSLRAAGSELTCLNSGTEELARDPLLAVCVATVIAVHGDLPKLDEHVETGFQSLNDSLVYGSRSKLPELSPTSWGRKAGKYIT